MARYFRRNEIGYNGRPIIRLEHEIAVLGIDHVAYSVWEPNNVNGHYTQFMTAQNLRERYTEIPYSEVPADWGTPRPRTIPTPPAPSDFSDIRPIPPYRPISWFDLVENNDFTVWKKRNDTPKERKQTGFSKFVKKHSL